MIISPCNLHFSDLFEEKPFSTEPSSPVPISTASPIPVTTGASPSTQPAGPGTTQSSVQTMQGQSQSEYVGLVIGVLLTIITLLIAGTFVVILRIRRGKYTPTHSLVGTRIQDRITAGIHFQVRKKTKGVLEQHIHISGPGYTIQSQNAGVWPSLSQRG